jgi:pSer/pThr/pTyr-binding forkhead associated (FHA) protein/actin-like ATPase involved in cell morphogenesis
VGYTVGIDLGTTYTAAAVADGSGARIVDLAHDRFAIRSLVAPPMDGTAAVIGVEALAIAATQPDRVAREFKRRFGDPTPMLVAGDAWAPEQLTSLLLGEVLERVTNLEGSAPSEVAITHPATWRDHRLSLLRDMAAEHGIGSMKLITEPVGAAIHYHDRQIGKADVVPDGGNIAVYDLGGGTFDAAILQLSGETYTIRGEPQGLDWLGGLDFDEVVLHMVQEFIGDLLAELDPTDPEARRAMARLREECTQAKVGLSYSSSALIPIVLPGHAEQVVVHRSDFEARISDMVDQTLAALEYALDSADIGGGDLHSILLVGGSSRVPVIAERLSARLGVRVVVDTHPKQAVAMGAALSTRPLASGSTTRPQASIPTEPGAIATSDVEVEPAVMPELTIDVSQLQAAVQERYLVVLNGPTAGETLDLPEGAVRIGRSTDAHVLTVPDPVMSREHFDVSRTGDAVTVSDLGSTNGTYIDGVQIGSPTSVQPGSIVEVGSTLFLLDGPLVSMPAPELMAEAWSMPALREESGLFSRVRGNNKAGREWVDALYERRRDLDQVADAIRRSRRLAQPSGPRTAAWSRSAPDRVHGRDSTDALFGRVTIGYGPQPSLIDLRLPRRLRSAERDEAEALLGTVAVDPWVPIALPLLGQTTIVAGNPSLSRGLLRSILLEFVAYHPTVPIVVFGLDPELSGWSFLQSDRLTAPRDDGAHREFDGFVVSYEPGRVAGVSGGNRGHEVGRYGTLRVATAAAPGDAPQVIVAAEDDGVLRFVGAGQDVRFLPVTLPV